MNYFKHHFLVATPQLHKSYFERAVILLIEHSKAGAFGLVVNKCAKTPVREVFDQLELKMPPTGELTLHLGGPVSPEQGIVLHPCTEQKWQDSSHIASSLTMTTSKDILAAMSQGEEPNKAKLVLGYSGWDAGQLESELLDNSWITVPCDEIDIFATSPSDLLEQVTGSIGLKYSQLMTAAGHA